MADEEKLPPDATASQRRAAPPSARATNGVANGGAHGAPTGAHGGSSGDGADESKSVHTTHGSQGFRELVNKLNTLSALNEELRRDSPGADIDLPRIIVVGAQSAGKSSVLQAIVGRNFIPSGSNIVTRVPLCLELNRIPPTDQTTKPRAVFLRGEGGPQATFTDMEDVKAEIRRRTDRLAPGKQVRNSPITLQIFAYDLPTLSLVDLPGLVQGRRDDQSASLKRDIHEMVMGYARNPRSIILAVAGANSDIMNSPALEVAQEVDSVGRRTIGILTKVDMLVKRGNAGGDVHRMQQMIADGGASTSFPLPTHGYVAVMTANVGKSSVTYAQAEKEEETFFASEPSLSASASRCGIAFLTSKIVKVLHKRIEEEVPAMLTELASRVKVITKKLAELEPMLKAEDHNRLLVGAAESAVEWLTANLDGVIQHKLGVHRQDVTVQLLHELLQSMFDAYRKKLEDIVSEINPFALRNFAVTVLRRTRGVIERQSIQRVFQEVLFAFRRPTMELLAKCAGIIYREIDFMDTPLRNKGHDEAHDKLIELITQGFAEQIEPCESFVRRFLDLEVFEINLDHPGFAEHRERLHGRMRNRHMTEVAMVAQTFVRPPFNPSSMCFICLHSLPRFSGTRHHCRRCGNTVCQDHSSYRGRLLVWQLEPNTGEERVCVACYKDLLRLRKAETSAAEDVRRANLERRAQRKLRARRRASQRGGLRVDSGAARRGSAGSASDNVAAQPGPTAAGKAHAGQPPLVDDRLAVTVPLPNAPRADMDMGEEEVDIGAQLIDLSQYKMDVMLFRRPATSKLKVMKEPRDERLVQVMVAAATQYALLMKEKLADEISKVVMFLLLERTRDKVFLPLQGIIMRQNLHRQFMSLMQPHLDGTQQQVDELRGQRVKYNRMIQTLRRR